MMCRAFSYPPVRAHRLSVGSDGMDAWNTAQSLLPEDLRHVVKQIPTAEEIRLRTAKPLAIVVSGREHALHTPTVTQDQLLHILEKATGASLYAVAASLKNGFISYRGLRIGVCGEGVYAQEHVTGLKNFSSLSIRIPHAEVTGCDALLDGVLRAMPVSTLIVSPPGGGKTSLLRELIRRSSSIPLRVSVIDDRNELSASIAGRTQFNLGKSCDVMVGVPKIQAAKMLLRGMNPQIIAMDEITQETDLAAAEEIGGCGVTLFATAHGRDLSDLKHRVLYKKLLDSGIFRELVTIHTSGGKRQYTREALP